MKTLVTDIGKLTLRPIVVEAMFDMMVDGVEIKNERGETAEIPDICIDEINEKYAVSLFIEYSI